MANDRTLARLDTSAWALIFGGLFVLVLGIASHDETAIGGWSLSVLGSLAVIGGIVLIVVRARMTPLPASSAQSRPPKKPETPE